MNNDENKAHFQLKIDNAVISIKSYDSFIYDYTTIHDYYRKYKKWLFKKVEIIQYHRK